ncbi:hypothetical protein [Micrococcus luteus]|uniref:hypothetical protein n=1 Tax=Micrococcus luteus TaxID=1270 RepID=UPI0035DEBB64
MLDVERDRVDAVVAGLKELGLDPEPSVFRRSTIACTGLEFCKLAIVDTKDTATAAIAQLEERLADLADRLPERLSLHVNGCPNSCARIQTADIGLKGQLLPDDDGGQTPGFQVHLGGGLASVDRAEAGLGRSVRGLKVRADGLVDYVERVVRRYDEQREPGETFARWAHRVDEEALR